MADEQDIQVEVLRRLMQYVTEYLTEGVVIRWEAHWHDVRPTSNSRRREELMRRMERTAVNPWAWATELEYNQGEVISGQSRTLYCAGQAAMGGDGEPQHAGDLAAQLPLSLDNLEAVLVGADMSLASLVRLTVYTTDVDLLFQHYGVLASRMGAAGVAPTTTMLGVALLALPVRMVELEGTAVA
jgi:enamine deaminase RidA (YjgF/YER057c/UK114 family)